MNVWDVVVIGGGPAGMMSAVSAGKCGRRVALLERNSCLGKKLLISGSGRCNLAQEGSPEDFLSVFADRAAFLKPAAYALPYKKITEFFNANGLKLKSQQGRVFPVSDRARDVVSAFERAMQKTGVYIETNAEAKEIAFITQERCFRINTTRGVFKARVLILCCGGGTYRNTGSDGSGYRLAISLGHRITRLSPALAAFKTGEDVSIVKGITMPNVVITYGRKSVRGAIIFTHFGISGPLIHNISADVLEKLPCRICFDFLPKISREGLLEILSENKEKSLSNRLAGFLPKRLARFIIGDVFSEQIAVEKVKGYCFDITGSLDFDFAMVTRGGVSRKEVFAKTMMSKKIKGLFFAGEILDIDGPTGGYNIQAAISTGYLAGVNAGG